MSVWRRRIVRFLGWWIAAFASIGAVAVIVLAGYLLVFDYPETLRVRLEQELTRLSGAPARIGSITLNIPNYSFELRGIHVARPPSEPDGEETVLLSVERILGRLQLAEIMRLRLHWTEIAVQGLRVRLDSGADSAVNLTRELPESSAFASAGFQIVADRISLEDAVFELSSTSVPWKLNASGLRFALERERGSYKGDIAWDEGVFSIKDHPEMRGSASATIELAGGELFVHEASATSELGSLTAKGKASLLGSATGRFDLEASGELDRVAATLLGLGDAARSLSGRAEFRGSLDLTTDNTQLEGTVVLESGRAFGLPLTDWGAQVFWDRQLLQISLAEGHLASGRARLQLHQPLPAADHMAAVEIDLADASLKAILDSMNEGPTPVRSRVSGQASLSFSYATPERVDGSFRLEGVPAESDALETAVFFDAIGEVSGGDIELTSASFGTHTLRGSLSGTYPRIGDPSLRVDVSSEDLSEMDRLAREVRSLVRTEGEPDPELWGISGEGRAEGTLTGRLPHPSFEGDVVASGLSFDRLHIDSVRGTAVMTRQQLALDSLIGHKGDGVAEGGGTIALTGALGSRDFDVRLSLSHWPASDLTTLLDWPAPIEGDMDGDLDLRRSGGRVLGTSRVTLSAPVILGERFDHAQAEIVFDPRGASLRDATLVRDGIPLRGALVLDRTSGTVTGRLEGRRFPLAGTEIFGLAVDGELDLRAEVSGTTDEPIVDLSGSLHTPRLFGATIPDASISGRLADGRFEVEARTGDGLSLSATGRTRGDVPVSGVLRFQQLDTSPWLAQISEQLVSSTKVFATGEARFESSLRDGEGFRAEATLAEVIVEGEAQRFTSLAPVDVQLQDGVLSIPTLSLARDQSQVELSGSVDFTGKNVDIRAEGNTDLDVLGAFYDNLAANGGLALSARVNGPWAQPTLSGHAELTRGALRIEGFPQALGDLTGRIVFDNRTVRIEELEGVFGSGPVSLTGAITLDGWELSSVDLGVSGSDMRLRYPEGLVATLDADLALLGTRDEQVLSGEVILTDAVWSREYDLVAGVLSDRASSGLFDAFEGDEVFDGVRFDVEIRAPGSLRLRNGIAEIDGSADLELRGSFREPVLLGTTEASGGELFLLGQRYDITSGKVDFVDPSGIVPFVELIAETRVRNYRVELRLTGTSSRFSPEITSDPPLRTVDILRLLSGASERDIGNTLVGNEEEELAGLGVASLLTERLSQEVGRRAERLFGLDRFSIDPFLVGRIANPTARVSIGKQISRDLSINYSTNLNATTEAIILIEYTPEGNMSWILSRDEEGDVAVDVKFRKSF